MTSSQLLLKNESILFFSKIGFYLISHKWGKAGVELQISEEREIELEHEVHIFNLVSHHKIYRYLPLSFLPLAQRKKILFFKVNPTLCVPHLIPPRFLGNSLDQFLSLSALFVPINKHTLVFPLAKLFSELPQIILLFSPLLLP